MFRQWVNKIMVDKAFHQGFEKGLYIGTRKGIVTRRVDLIYSKYLKKYSESAIIEQLEEDERFVAKVISLYENAPSIDSHIISDLFIDEQI